MEITSFALKNFFGGGQICNDEYPSKIPRMSISTALWKRSLTNAIIIIYYLLTESEDILGKSQIETLMYWPSDSEVNKAEVWDFPVMTERTKLISYLLYGLFSAILKRNTIKTPEVIFHICLRALWLSSSPILKKYLYASFSFSCWKYSCTLSIFSVVFAHAQEAFTHNSKEPSSREKIS